MQHAQAEVTHMKSSLNANAHTMVCVGPPQTLETIASSPCEGTGGTLSLNLIPNIHSRSPDVIKSPVCSDSHI